MKNKLKINEKKKNLLLVVCPQYPIEKISNKGFFIKKFVDCFKKKYTKKYDVEVFSPTRLGILFEIIKNKNFFNYIRQMNIYNFFDFTFFKKNTFFAKLIINLLVIYHAKKYKKVYILYYFYNTLVEFPILKKNNVYKFCHIGESKIILKKNIYADEVIKYFCVSRNLKNILSKDPNIKNKAIYLPNGISITKQNKIYNRRVIDNENFSKKLPNIIFVGALIKRKSPNIFFKFQKVFKEANFICIGDGKSIKNRNILHLKNIVNSKVLNLMGNSHFLFHPSKSEGMSNVILESLSKGMIIICRDIKENREFLFNKKFVIYINKYDKKINFDLLKKKILSIIKKNKWNSLSKKAKSYSLKYSITKRVIEIEKEFSSV